MNEIMSKELNFIKKFMEFSYLGNHLTGKSMSIKSLSQERHFFFKSRSSSVCASMSHT